MTAENADEDTDDFGEFEEIVEGYEITMPDVDQLTDYFVDTVTGYRAKLIAADWPLEQATEMAVNLHNALVFKVMS